MPKRLTPSRIAAYERDGFVAPVDIMSASEAHDLRRRFEEAERRFPERLHSEQRDNAHYEFGFMDEIVHDGRILDAVEDLIGPDILLWSTVLFVREPRSSAHVSFHQDATYMGLEPHVGVTVWLALTEATTANGCMLMERGNHRDGRDTFGGDNILTRGQTIRAVNPDRVVPVELAPGRISLHHMRTVHASAPNTSDGRRIGIALQSYLPPTVRQPHGDDFALLARGEDRFGHFRHGRRPLSDGEPGACGFATRPTSASRRSCTRARRFVARSEPGMP